MWRGPDEDYAAGVTAHVLKRWKAPKDRMWFAGCLRLAAEMIEENRDMKVPLLELPRTTMRRLKRQRLDS